jgi:hypothetical protein
MNIVLGLLSIAAGVVLVLKAEWFYRNFGPIEWAEMKLGSSGGSRLMYQLIGLVAILFGFLLIFNLFGGIVRLIFAPTATSF